MEQLKTVCTSRGERGANGAHDSPSPGPLQGHTEYPPAVPNNNAVVLFTAKVYSYALCPRMHHPSTCSMGMRYSATGIVRACTVGCSVQTLGAVQNTPYSAPTSSRT